MQLLILLLPSLKVALRLLNDRSGYERECPWPELIASDDNDVDTRKEQTTVRLVSNDK